MTVSGDDSHREKVLVDTRGIVEMDENEIGIGGIDPLNRGEGGVGLGHTRPLGNDCPDVILLLGPIVERLDDTRLREAIDVVGVLDILEKLDDLLGRESETASDASEAPCLGESLKDNQVGIIGELREPGRLGGETLPHARPGT